MPHAPGSLPSHLGYAQRDMTNHCSHAIGPKKETLRAEMGKGGVRAPQSTVIEFPLLSYGKVKHMEYGNTQVC